MENFSVDPAVSVLVGSLCAMAEQVIAEKTIIRMKNVREINNVQVQRSHVDLAMVSGIYVFPGRHVATA